VDADAARELKIFTENDADLYRQRTTPIVRNLRTKQAQGVYDHDKAVALFMYLAEAGARKYAKEYSTGESEWSKMFPKDVRLAVSREWRDEFETESALGNYDNATYLPKKYLEALQSGKKPQQRTARVGSDSSSDGAELAQRVASNLQEKEIERIVLLGLDPPGRKRGPVFKRGYLNRMQSILNASGGN
jgi:hypothetical protein